MSIMYDVGVDPHAVLPVTFVQVRLEEKEKNIFPRSNSRSCFTNVYVYTSWLLHIYTIIYILDNTC